MGGKPVEPQAAALMFNEGKVDRLSTFTAQRKPKGRPPPSQRRKPQPSLDASAPIPAPV